ncbi:MAG: XTP/dITP diphosphohydrolase, partial [Actinomycetota bacterium]|nr:XTP/dITP diphosphohydrolase [Actinomycetota bacterium]
MKFPLVLATANPDKAREICEVLTDVWDHALAAWALEVQQQNVGFLLDTPDGITSSVERVRTPAGAPDVEEIGDTLEDNARIKASALCDAYALPAVADDTGLEVDALGGAPGVRSARYAGDDAQPANNVSRLLRELNGVDSNGRSARFVTIALARFVDGKEIVVRGEVEGTITTEPRGAGGFGYDPVFAPREGDGRTFAQMQP